MNGIVELAGPDSAPIAEFVGRFLAATGDTRTVVADPQARYFGAVLDGQGLNPAGNRARRPDAVQGLARPLGVSRVSRRSPSSGRAYRNHPAPTKSEGLDSGFRERQSNRSHGIRNP